VKTLHPGVHGGILAIRSNAEHMAAIKQHDISTIDVVRGAVFFSLMNSFLYFFGYYFYYNSHFPVLLLLLTWCVAVGKRRAAVANSCSSTQQQQSFPVMLW
jgi:hypothetical protein